MDQKRVSFEVAKAIKEAGYPQSFYCPQYKENGELENGFTDLGEGCIYAPTYIDVWLWLWREKKKSISIICDEDDRLEANWYVNAEKLIGGIGSFTEQVFFEDPEDAIIAAIEYLVDNDLVK